MMAESVVSAELVIEEFCRMSLTEVCATCHIDMCLVSEMVAEGVIEPSGASPEDWRFDGIALRRLRTAARLQRDLGVNLAGAALALDLLEELAQLRKRLST